MRKCQCEIKLGGMKSLTGYIIFDQLQLNDICLGRRVFFCQDHKNTWFIIVTVHTKENLKIICIHWVFTKHSIL